MFSGSSFITLTQENSGKIKTPSLFREMGFRHPSAILNPQGFMVDGTLVRSGFQKGCYQMEG
jgi:hypothetical protein